jgi:integrase
MSKVYKRGDTYHCEYRDAAKRRRRESTGCTDRAAAKLYADRREREAADPRHAAANATTVEAALERLITDRATKGRASGTITMYASKAGHLRRILGAATPLGQIGPREVDAFLEQRLAEGAARNTVSKELTTLRAALKVAKRRGEYPGDIAETMPNGFSAEYVPRRRVLRNTRELEALVEALLRADDKSDRVRAIGRARAAHVLFFIATAARDSESSRAERRDIDLARGVVRMRGTKTEASDDTIPIVSWMRPLLELVLELRAGVVGPLFDRWSNVRRDLGIACEAAGLEPLTPNDLRRTHATWLRAAGVEPALIARMLRHTDARMVERVYGRMPADAAGAALAARLGEPLPLRALPAAPSCDAGVSDVGGLDGLSGPDGLQKPAVSVPRDGIEPPTRGFSIRLPGAREPEKRSGLVKLRRVV